MNFVYRKLTDVAHIDLTEPDKGARIEVLECGDEIGFPGQVLVRFNPDTNEIYGLTLQRYSAIKRKLVWQHRSLMVQRFVDELVQKVVDVFNQHHNHNLPALSH